MLEALFGNRTAEQILLFLSVNPESYAQEMVSRMNLTLYAVQRQLKRLEEGGIIASRPRGRMRFYSLNPRLPFTPDLIRLLTVALQSLPAHEQGIFSPRRNRPRLPGKPA